MIVPENIRKCVAFLGVQTTEGEFRLAGSVFWIGQDRPPSPEGGPSPAQPVYAVTARHVIDAIRNIGAFDVYLRVNLKTGNAAWMKSDLSDWYTHPSDPTIDVAILKTDVPIEWDHLVLPYSLCMTDALIQEHEISLGDEVFVTGLFSHHHGSRRNIPIVRVGNLAGMAEEKIQTRDFGLMEAILVEARSIGGLSGSPVFVNLGVTRMINGQVKHATGGGPIFFLIGVIHGHFDVGSGGVDATDLDAIDSVSAQHVNTGIAIVTPFHRVRTVIEAFEKSS